MALTCVCSHLLISKMHISLYILCVCVCVRACVLLYVMSMLDSQMSHNVSGDSEGNPTGSRVRPREVRKKSNRLPLSTNFNSHYAPSTVCQPQSTPKACSFILGRQKWCYCNDYSKQYDKTVEQRQVICLNSQCVSDTTTGLKWTILTQGLTVYILRNISGWHKHTARSFLN